MNVHYFQHVPFEGPGSMEPWLLAQGHRLSSTHFYSEGFLLPEPGEVDALIVLGGPMNVYDDQVHSWLPAEKAFIGDCIRSGKKVLGICLGAQLIACCLGATVYAAANREIGWFPVFPTNECKAVPWFYELFKDQPVVFHWHGDQFDLPDESLDLLYSEANSHQAFLKGGDVIALQFHLETTEEGLRAMLAHCGADLNGSAFTQSAQALEAGLPRLAHSHRTMAALLTKWLA